MDSLTMVAASLEEIQTSIYNKALSFREYNITRVDSYDEFKTSRWEGRIYFAHWDGTTETELASKEETKATIRCIPITNPLEDGKCIFREAIEATCCLQELLIATQNNSVLALKRNQTKKDNS